MWKTNEYEERECAIGMVIIRKMKLFVSNAKVPFVTHRRNICAILDVKYMEKEKRK